MEQYNILIVEDDKEIRDGIEIFLKSQNYNVYKAADGIEGLEIIESKEIHLAIVDIMMPRMDGVTMTLKLREHHDFPVIMLSAKSEETDKVIGLNIGADDYVTKPFTPLELMARVNSQIRRYTKFNNKSQEKKENDRVHIIGGIELNEDTVEVFVDGKPVKMTPIEFKILALLMKNPGRVYSADEIYERVWNEKAINTDTIMVHVRNIREKIELDIEVGDMIVVTSGAWEGTTSAVTAINESKQTVTIEVEMFGRATSVEIDFLDIKKA